MCVASLLDKYVFRRPKETKNRLKKEVQTNKSTNARWVVYEDNFKKKKDLKRSLNNNNRFRGIQFIKFETDKSSSCGDDFRKTVGFPGARVREIQNV